MPNLGGLWRAICLIDMAYVLHTSFLGSVVALLIGGVFDFVAAVTIAEQIFGAPSVGLMLASVRS